MSPSILKFRLSGGFRAETEAGLDKTPVGMKNQALLALLLTAPEFKRSRAWLQSKLWSDRAPTQASGSLRQALVQIRKTFGKDFDIVQTTRSTVQLNPELIELLETVEGLDVDQEFLLGLDVRDPEFESWLCDMRRHHSKDRVSNVPPEAPDQIMPRPERGLWVFLTSSNSPDPAYRLLEEGMLDQIQKSINDLFDVTCVRGLPSIDGQRAKNGLVVSIQSIGNEHGKSWMRASVSTTSLRSLWSGTAPFSKKHVNSHENVGLMRLSYQVISAITDALAQSRTNLGLNASAGDIIAATAMRTMFKMRPEEVTTAEKLLNAALEAQPRGLFHALLAQIKSIRHVEQQGGDFEGLRDESRAHVAYALEAESSNSIVLAATATARLIFDKDLMQATALARQSVLANRSNPYAWWAWSNANLYGGDYKVANSAAQSAERLAEGSPMQFWTSFQCGITSTVQDQMGEALNYMTLSSALSPNYRPALRYLVTLSATLEKFDTAIIAAQRLADIEEGFSIDQLVHDETYPVSMMRKANMFDEQKLANLEDIAGPVS